MVACSSLSIIIEHHDKSLIDTHVAGPIKCHVINGQNLARLKVLDLVAKECLKPKRGYGNNHQGGGP